MPTQTIVAMSRAGLIRRRAALSKSFPNDFRSLTRLFEGVSSLTHDALDRSISRRIGSFFGTAKLHTNANDLSSVESRRGIYFSHQSDISKISHVSCSPLNARYDTLCASSSATLDFQRRFFAASGGGGSKKRGKKNSNKGISKAKLNLGRSPASVSAPSGLILPGSPEFIAKSKLQSSQQQLQAEEQPPPKTLIKSDLTNHYTDVILNQSEETRTYARQNLPLPEPTFEADERGVSQSQPEDMIDLQSLYDPSVHLPDKPDFSTDLADDGMGNKIKYEVATPLSDELIRLIGVRGPITVAEYMRMALRHPTLGYYTSAGRAKDELEDMFEEDEEEEKDIEDDDDDWDNDWDLDDDEDKDKSDTPMPAPASTSTKTQDGSKVIGPRGDFTTAPEISQIFGEALLVWYLTQYQSIGCPSKIQLVEIGPGRGTLICDILRSVLSGGSAGECSGLFDQFSASLSRGGGVHLVELGRALRAEQRDKLSELGALKLGGYSFDFVEPKDGDADGENDQEDKDSKEQAPEKDNDEKDLIQIHWHDLLADVPSTVTTTTDDAAADAKKEESIPTFIVCQEIIDALPVHSFQKTEWGWRERLVDVAVREEDPDHVKASTPAVDDSTQDESNLSDEDKVAAAKRRFAAAQNQSMPPVRKRYSDAEASQQSKPEDGGALFVRKPRLRFVLPPDTTPALRTLLNVDPKTGKMIGPNAAALDAAAPGDVMEVCPEGMMLAQDIASRIEKCGGAALIIDYGGEGSSDTLRAFKRHKQAHPLSSPGSIDVTADVDFAALKEAVNNGMDAMRRLKREAEEQAAGEDGDSSSAVPATDAPVAFGPLPQGKFLASMGAVERVVALIEKDSTTEEQAEELAGALERLIQPEHMGERYKVLAIARKKDGIFAPPAF